MHLFGVQDGALAAVKTVPLESAGLKGREDLARLLRDEPDALGERLLVLDEAFSYLEERRDRIDLLALDPRANLVVVLLRTTDGPDDAQLQALRYAAILRTMSYDQVAAAYDGYLGRRRLLKEISARQRISYFLNTEGPVQISATPRIILVAPHFSKETVATAHWLNEAGIGVACVQVHAYSVDGATLLGFEPVLPGPLVSGYQNDLRRKQQERDKSEAERQHRNNALKVLLAHHAVKPGDALVLDPEVVRPDNGSDARFRARFSANIRSEQNVTWEYDNSFYSLSGLCETLRDVHGLPFPHGPLNGYTWWRLEGHTETLGELAESLAKRVTSDG